MKWPLQNYGGVLTLAQAEVFARHVEGQVVLDLGAGDGAVTECAVLYGAKHVHYVDKSVEMARDFFRVFSECYPDATNVSVHVSLFDEPYLIEAIGKGPKPTVAVVSWPVCTPTPGLVELIRELDVVIYMGSNTEGTACGAANLWGDLFSREVLVHVPDRPQVLTIYGAHTVSPRPRTSEEIGAMSGAYHMPDAARWDDPIGYGQSLELQDREVAAARVKPKWAPDRAGCGSLARHRGSSKR